MGAPLTEFVFETVIRDGLGELQANPDRLDDIFGGFLETHFNNQYGQAKIDELKTYVQNNQIRIVQALGMAPSSMPCISIQLLNSAESEELQELSNELPEEDESKTPEIYVPIVTPGSYDFITGKLTVINAADLSTICPGNIFVDNSGTKFTILSGNSNIIGNKFINIGSGKEPNIGGDGRIESSIDVTRSDMRMIRLREVISLGCHAKDDLHLAKYIWVLLTYILKSRQLSLESRGIALDQGNTQLFDRLDDFQGENVFSRYVEVSCITQFEWNQGEVNLVDCFETEVKVPTPDPDSDNAGDYNTSN